MPKRNPFNEFDPFDVAEGLYIWLCSNHGGKSSDKMLCELTAPGLFKPSPSLEYNSLQDEGHLVYDLLTEQNMNQALRVVKNYEPQD